LPPRHRESRDDGGEGAKEIGAAMETVVVWLLACLVYWWGLL
jgi:hypothetical protein